MSAVRILPDPAQIAAADPGQSVFVTANAGSGKTSTLVDRVARLLLREVQPGEILCVTYTKAAAAEMQARLFDQLCGWAVLDDDQAADEAYAAAFRRDTIGLWLLAIGLPFILTLLCKAVLSAF